MGELALSGDIEMTTELEKALWRIRDLMLTSAERNRYDQTEFHMPGSYMVKVRIDNRAHFDIHRPIDKSLVRKTEEPGLIAKAADILCQKVRAERLN